MTTPSLITNIPTYGLKTLAIQTRVIDAVTPLDEHSGGVLKSAGIDAVVQYAPTMNKTRLASILSTGLALMLIGGYADKPDAWSPNAGLGRSEGQASVLRAKSCEYFPGAVLWCDIETPNPGAHAQDILDYGNAWAAEVGAAGYLPGVYIGAGVRLTPSQLYSMRFVRYWRAGSMGVPEPTCGWSMIQLYPLDQVLQGIGVDYDIVQGDEKLRFPVAMIQT